MTINSNSTFPSPLYFQGYTTFWYLFYSETCSSLEKGLLTMTSCSSSNPDWDHDAGAVGLSVSLTFSHCKLPDIPSHFRGKLLWYSNFHWENITGKRLNPLFLNTMVPIWNEAPADAFVEVLVFNMSLWWYHVVWPSVLLPTHPHIFPFFYSRPAFPFSLHLQQGSCQEPVLPSTPVLHLSVY